MRRQRWARAWFAVTAVAVLVGLVVQVVVVARETPDRVGQVFAYFTIQSNILVLAGCAILAVRPAPPSTAFRVLRLAGLVGIAVTGVVFHTVLVGLRELAGGAALADFLLHTVSPLMTVLGWLLFGPRGAMTWRAVCLALLFPLLWLVFTLVRGPFADFYPYPFLDVRVLGYPVVLVNCVVVAALFLALSAGAFALDRVLTRRVAAAS